MYTRKNEIYDLAELGIFEYRFRHYKENAEEMEILDHKVGFRRSMLANKQQLANLLGDETKETPLSRVIKKYYMFSEKTGLGRIDYIGTTAYFAPAR